MDTAVMADEQKIENNLVEINNQALTLKITDNGTYSQAGTVLLAYKDLEKQIKNYFKPIKETAHKTWKQICDKENTELEKLKEGINHLSIEMANWNVEQEKIRKAEEERLHQEALKREEEERLQAAIQADTEGNKEEAQAILNEPVFVPPPIVPKSVPKQEGLAMRETWTFRVVDVKALVKAVADGSVPLMAVMPNTTFLGQQARALKGTAKYNGVEFYSEKSMVGVRR